MSHFQKTILLDRKPQIVHKDEISIGDDTSRKRHLFDAVSVCSCFTTLLCGILCYCLLFKLIFKQLRRTFYIEVNKTQGNFHARCTQELSNWGAEPTGLPLDWDLREGGGRGRCRQAVLWSERQCSRVAPTHGAFLSLQGRSLSSLALAFPQASFHSLF